MKKRFIRMISAICAALMTACAVSAWAAAEEEPATPTDLGPAEEELFPDEYPEDMPEEPEDADDGEYIVEHEENLNEEAVPGVEVVITRTLTIGQDWSGKMGRKKPAVLKLDVDQACSVYMLAEGRDVWVTVEKSDHVTENPPRTQTDPKTGKAVISWEAEEGSYLITLGPVEPNLLAMATVTFMDAEAYQAWEAAQPAAQPEPEPEPDPQPETEEKPEPEPEPQEEDPGQPEEEPEAPEEEPEEEETEQPEREILVDVGWDVPDPVIGDTAHFRATLIGYEGLTYSVQWQYSPDEKTWYDIHGETETEMDVVVTEENNLVYWRIMVYVEDDQEI